MLRKARRPFWILIVGPDGSGKSFASNELVDSLNRKEIVVIHKHFQIWKSLSGKLINYPHDRKMRTSFIAFLAITYRFMRYFLCLLKIKFSDVEVIVQERGWLDQLIDPKRYRIPHRALIFIEKFQKLLFKPNLIVLCNAKPEQIYERKNELSLDEIRRQIQDWRQYINFEIDTSSKDIKYQIDSILEIYANYTFSGLRKIILTPKRMNLYSNVFSSKQYKLVYFPRRKWAKILQRLSFLRTYSNDLPLSEKLSRLVPYLVQTDLFRTNICVLQSNRKEQWVICLASRNHSPSCYLRIAECSSVSNEEMVLRKLKNIEFDLIVTPAVIDLVHLSEQYCSLITKPLKRIAEIKRKDLNLANLELLSKEIVHPDLKYWNAFKTSENKIAIIDWNSSTN